MFSESHSRYLVEIERENLDIVKKILSKSKCAFAQIGTFSGDHIIFKSGSESILKLRVDKAANFYLNSLEKIIQSG